MPRTRPLLLRLGILCLLTIAALGAMPLWLPLVGEYLVKAGAPQKADVILVLAGDRSGNRIVKGAELARQGYAPVVAVSGPDEMYGLYESDLAIAFAERKGYPKSLFLPLPNRERNTRDEAIAMLRELHQRGFRRILLVTSDTHTRRAGAAYRKFAGTDLVAVVASPSAEFRPEVWWKEREGRKEVFYEWAKTVATWFGI